MHEEMNIDLERRTLLRKFGMGIGVGALAVAAVKPALAETVLTDTYIETGETKERLSKSATVVVGKSGAVDYLTTDYGSDDACIQAAIDYVDGLGGGSVLIREGIYTIEDELTITGNNIILNGVGNATILKRVDTTNFYSIINLSGNNCNISDIQIDGNESTNRVSYTEGHGITIRGGNDNIINKVYSHSCYRDPFCIEWAYGSTYAYRNKISNCVAEDSYTDHLIYISGSSDNIVSDCILKGFWFNEAIKISEDIYNAVVRKSERNIISNTIITASVANPLGTQELSATAIGKAGTGYDSEGNKYVNCNFDTSAIGLTKLMFSLPKTEIINCTLTQSYIDIHAETSVNSVVNNNIISINNNTADTKFGIEIISDNVIVGNNLLHMEKSSTGEVRTIAITEDRSGILFQGNTIIQEGVNGIVGFRMSGASPTLTDSIISNNILVNVSSPFVNFTIGGTFLTGNRIINNTGYNPIGAVGPPSVPATTVNYTNAYGYPCQVQVYGGTVSEIDIDDIATGLTSGIFMIPPGGTINITYSAAPSWRWWGL